MKKKFTVIAFLLVGVLCLCGVSAFAVAESAESGESRYDNELSLGERSEIEENFDFHFVSTQNARRTDKLDYTWQVRDGAIWRVGNIDSNSDTVNIAIMTYTGDVFDDFELSVDIKAGSLTSFWPVIGIRQQIPGKYYTTSGGGTGVFMQQNGKITLWGPLSNGIIEKEAAKNWLPMMWHNMRIVAQGTLVSVWIDDTLVLEQTLNSTDYVKGYVSLQSVNNDCAFRNFKIKSLSKQQNNGNEENKYSGAHDGTPLEELI